MTKILSISLDKESSKIFERINKKRPYGWFSKDVQDFLKKKYGSQKSQLIDEINFLQAKRDRIEERIKEIAKKVNKMKDD